MWIIIVSNEKWKVTYLVYVNRTVPNVYSTHSFFSELSGLHELHINRKFFWLYLLWVLCASTACYFNVEPRQQIGQLCFKRNSEFIKWITVLCAEFRWFAPWNTLSFTELLLKIPSVVNSNNNAAFTSFTDWNYMSGASSNSSDLELSLHIKILQRLSRHLAK